MKSPEIPTGWPHILVITCPVSEIKELAALRDHVTESLREGVLVLPEDCSYCLEQLPDRLGVRIEGAPPGNVAEKSAESPTEDGPEPEDTEKIMDVRLHGGRNANEKQEIQEKLLSYRQTHGLGCWKAVAGASRGQLTEDDLRHMTAGTGLFPISQWRAAAKALEAVDNG